MRSLRRSSPGCATLRSPISGRPAAPRSPRPSAGSGGRLPRSGPSTSSATTIRSVSRRSSKPWIEPGERSCMSRARRERRSRASAPPSRPSWISRARAWKRVGSRPVRPHSGEFRTPCRAPRSIAAGPTHSGTVASRKSSPLLDSTPSPASSQAGCACWREASRRRPNQHGPPNAARRGRPLARNASASGTNASVSPGSRPRPRSALSRRWMRSPASSRRLAAGSSQHAGARGAGPDFLRALTGVGERDARPFLWRPRCSRVGGGRLRHRLAQQRADASPRGIDVDRQRRPIRRERR
jgi:hypothetical protein